MLGCKGLVLSNIVNIKITKAGECIDDIDDHNADKFSMICNDLTTE